MRTWLFQGNPEKFDVDAYLSGREQRDILWLVRPLKLAGSIRRGDRAFIWRSDGAQRASGGVVACGEILTVPSIQEDDEGKKHWKDSMGSGAAMRVPIHLREVRLTPSDGMLLRTELEEHPTLRKLHNLRFRPGTTFPVADYLAEVLHDLWSGWEIFRV